MTTRYAIRQLPGREKYIPWDLKFDRPHSHYALPLPEAKAQVAALNGMWPENLTQR